MSKAERRLQRRSRRNADGSKTIPLSPAAIAAFKTQEQAFIAKFGREPGPGDPVFFDPEKDTPTPYSDEQSKSMWEDVLEAARKAGVDPAIIYAMQVTERIVTQENKHLLLEDELEEWNAAVQEFREKS